MVRAGEPALGITVLTPRLIRVRLAVDGSFRPRRSWSVVRPNAAFPDAGFSVRTSQRGIVVRTDAVAVHVRRDPVRIAFSDLRRNRFCADNDDGMRWGPDGLSCVKRIEPDEHYYGFGERTGLLDKRGWVMVNWTTDPASDHGPGTDPMYAAIPVFIALRPGLTYGLFLNNTWRSEFDMGATSPDLWKMHVSDGELDYYVAFGPSPAQVLEELSGLLGRTPLPPLWALGFHQSRWSYDSEDRVREVATEMRERRIPCDAIHIDIDHMDGYRVFTWDAERFPDPPALTKDLSAMGISTVAIADPGIKVEPDYDVYRTGLERGLFVRKANGAPAQGFVWPDEAVFPDFVRAEVRKWWGEVQRRHLDAGVRGIWNDMNEPTTFDGPFSKGFCEPHTLPSDCRHGDETDRAVHAEVHNMYGSLMAQASYEGLRKHRRDERPFVLTRSAFAGIQRWSACWMGDNTSWWEHLRMTIPQVLNMGLSGVPFAGVDIGGFRGNASPELFARWMQLGALLPFCRAHSAHGTQPHEPWSFGREVESVCRDYLRLRYRLLPYIYTLFWEASQNGTPVLRPLFFHFPDDPVTHTIDDQFLLGPSMLLAPVLEPNREHRYVYLPEGDWYNGWSGERVEGPAHLLEQAPLDCMPLFIRAGAIVPSGPDIRHTGQKGKELLILDVYPGDEGEFTLYEDDGISMRHTKGEYCTTRVTQRSEDGVLELCIGERKGRFAPPKRRLSIRLHAVDGLAAKGHPDAIYDPDRQTLSLDVENSGNEQTLRFRG